MIYYALFLKAIILFLLTDIKNNSKIKNIFWK